MDDPRLTPARPEVAAKYLEGKVKAARFVEGEVLEVVEAIAPRRAGPFAGAGLVQVSLNAAGYGCPRDSDMQRDGLGRTLDAAEMHKLRRGDLIFWKGHVAVVRDSETIVHANAHYMATVVENTREAIARIKA